MAAFAVTLARGLAKSHDGFPAVASLDFDSGAEGNGSTGQNVA
ncbi:MAG: hypothetical protein ACYCS7_15070 [Acidimicrobiales bacterium]